MTTEEMKAWIDGATYMELLKRWRFSVDDPVWFTGEVGDHYVKVMTERRDADPAGHVAASKAIGW